MLVVKLMHLFKLWCRGANVHHCGYATCFTVRFGSIGKVLAKCKLKFYRISQCACCTWNFMPFA